jgi:hypothetical protein
MDLYFRGNYKGCNSTLQINATPSVPFSNNLSDYFTRKAIGINLDTFYFQ